MSKPKVGFYWCASCGGCEEGVLDLNEAVLDVVNAVDIVFWPVALDFKREDVEKMKDGEFAVVFVNGAIRSSEQEEMAQLLRKKANLLVAFGSCAQLGGIPGLANLYSLDSILDRAYFEAPSVSNDDKVLPRIELDVPEGKVTLPKLWETVKSLEQVVDVDYYLPGCPPPTKLIVGTVTSILEGKLPAKGAVLAPNIALCDDCPRKKTKPDKPLIKEYKRPHEIIIDAEKCLLVQGLLCLGPATRSACDAACIGANMPCTGCMGPTSHVKDFGAKALSAVTSILDCNDEKEIARAMAQIVDPTGTFYRYSLPASQLHRKVNQERI